MHQIPHYKEVVYATLLLIPNSTLQCDVVYLNA